MRQGNLNRVAHTADTADTRTHAASMQRDPFVAGDKYPYNPAAADDADIAQRTAMDEGFDHFFDPAMDEHSTFYRSMELDKHAAHLVSGASFLDLNTVVLRTECNNAYESMNDEDMQKLRKLMWDVYIPDMKRQVADTVANDRQDVSSFTSQMYVVHLSIRVAQALQLVFELNQKKSFSAAVKTAYEMALQDVLFHPGLRGHVSPSQYDSLINFLRRHPAYSTAFNTYVGLKLLRQQLVRGGGAGTNRKSNDAERLHDEAANRLWGVLQDNARVYSDFKNAKSVYTAPWHRLYYKEVAKTLHSKLAEYHSDAKHYNEGDTLPAEERHNIREQVARVVQQSAAAPAAPAAPGGGGGGGGGGVGGDIAASDVAVGRHRALDSAVGVDILGAMRESRELHASGTTKRSKVTHGVGDVV